MRSTFSRISIVGFSLLLSCYTIAQTTTLKIIGTGKLNYDAIRNDWTMGEARKLSGEIILNDPQVIIGKDTLVTDMNPLYSQQNEYIISAWNATRKNSPYRYIFRSLVMSGDRMVYYQIIEAISKEGIFYMALVR